jgi:hypothetical protein
VLVATICDKVTDANGLYEFNDPSELTFGGFMYTNFKLKFKPPASCDICEDPPLLPWRGGRDFDGYHGMDITVDYRFAPKPLDPTKDTGGGGGT